MADDLISRSELKQRIIKDYRKEFFGSVLWNVLDDMPTIDAVAVVHAENVTPTHSTDMFVCGNCGFTCEITKLIYEDEDYPEVGIPIAFEYDCKYCPDCGAKMDAKEDA